MRMICVWLNRPSRLTLHTNPPPLELFQFFTFLTSLIIFSWFWIIIFLFIFLFFFFFFFRGGKREFRALFWPEKSALFESIRVAYIIPTHLLQPWLDGLKNTRHVPPLILPRKKKWNKRIQKQQSYPLSRVHLLCTAPLHLIPPDPIHLFISSARKTRRRRNERRK